MQVFLDRPIRNKLPSLAQFSGWIQYPSHRQDRFTFFLNDFNVQCVKIHERADVPEQQGMRTFGWSFMLEMDRLRCNAHGAVTLKIMHEDGEIFRRYFRKADCPDPPLTFMMHIPKTAGTSLRSAIEANYPRARILQVYDDPAHHSIADLEDLSEKAFDQLSIVFGHYSFGLHKYTSRKYEYISFLRPPLHFVKSYVLFMKHVARHDMFANKSLINILRASQVIELDNCYTRFFSGRLDGKPIGEKDCMRAMVNVESSFALVGNVMHMDAGARRLSEHLGREINIGHLNTTPYRAEMHDMSEDEFDRVAAERVKYDLLLYDFIMQRFPPASPSQA